MKPLQFPMSCHVRSKWPKSTIFARQSTHQHYKYNWFVKHSCTLKRGKAMQSEKIIVFLLFYFRENLGN